MTEQASPHVIGKLLARARREAGVEQQVMAARIPIGVRTLSRWENGGGYPSPSQAERIALLVREARPETWRALVQACGLSLDAMLDKLPGDRERLQPPASAPPSTPPPASQPRVVGEAPPSEVLVLADEARPPARAPALSALDAQADLDDAIRAYAEELDVSAKRLRTAFALLLGDAGALGLTLDETRAIVLRRPRRWR